jgi:predicted branched-subunit amino acid permease
MLPLWAGAIPSGIAFGVAAHAAGIDGLTAQMMSLVVFSSAAQISTVGPHGLDQSPLAVIVTALALNAHLLLLGAAVNERCAPSWRQRPITAWFLTDGAFGVAAAKGRLLLPVLLGAGVSMYLAWNTGTAIGHLAGSALPASARTGIDLVVPLTFLAVLVPLLRSRYLLIVALAAAGVTCALNRIVPAGIAVLIAGLIGVVIGERGSKGD